MVTDWGASFQENALGLVIPRLTPHYVPYVSAVCHPRVHKYGESERAVTGHHPNSQGVRMATVTAFICHPPVPSTPQWEILPLRVLRVVNYNWGQALCL